MQAEATQAELTIVIPAKNEAEMLPRLLASLCRQDYVGPNGDGMNQVRVLVADAGSTDGTVELALSFQDRLKIEVIPGGLPAVGRNAGARLTTTKYVLFLDADVELPESTLLRRAMWRMKRRNLHLVTTNISCREGRLLRQSTLCRQQLHAVCRVVPEAVCYRHVHAVRPRAVLGTGRLQ